jgi:hypothetical protein
MFPKDKYFHGKYFKNSLKHLAHDSTLKNNEITRESNMKSA